MLSARAAAGVVALGLLLSSCARHEAAARYLVDDSHPGGLSEIRFDDPRAAIHFLEGFHAENNPAWRWTERKFAVALAVPQRGREATLELRFTLVKAILDRLHSVTLAATAGGVALAPQTYSTVGNQAYTRPVPASALSGDLVRIDFTLDKTVPPGEIDGRELGVIVTAAALR